MKSAVTLVHKGAMPIAVHAVRSFARNFTGTYRLRIHSDGSLDADDEATLLTAAASMPAVIVRPEDRTPLLEQRTADYPLTRALLSRGAYFTKMQLPVCEETPYFYFDSDIVWLAPVANLEPPDAPNAFSTESWSWYHGVANDSAWIRDGVPRRVNSGFYYLSEPFPHERMEDMLARRLFDSTIRYNTDQEIMAYLYREMEYYHPEDFKRSRRSTHYDLKSLPAAALHFPGGMWQEHLAQMETVAGHAARPAISIRYEKPLPLTFMELMNMRFKVWISDNRLLAVPINWIRLIRKIRKIRYHS